MRSANTAGDIELFLNHIVPEAFAGIKKRIIFSQSGNISHSGIKIDGTDCVADGFILFPDRKMSLIIGVTETVQILFDFFRMLLIEVVRLFSSFIDKVFCKV